MLDAACVVVFLAAAAAAADTCCAINRFGMELVRSSSARSSSGAACKQLVLGMKLKLNDGCRILFSLAAAAIAVVVVVAAAAAAAAVINGCLEDPSMCHAVCGCLWRHW